ncbi:hypothetical protein N9948_00285 [bacterium]|nr:hypothetical protein [bacterium]
MKLLLLAFIPFTLMARVPSYLEHKEIEFNCIYFEHPETKECMDKASGCFYVLTEKEEFMFIEIPSIIEACVEIVTPNKN